MKTIEELARVVLKFGNYILDSLRVDPLWGRWRDRLATIVFGLGIGSGVIAPAYGFAPNFGFLSGRIVHCDCPSGASVHRWPSRQASQIIPPPTSNPPTIAAKISANWIIDGSTSEKNWPMYVEISATFILIVFGIGYAVIGIILWLLSLARRKE